MYKKPSIGVVVSQIITTELHKCMMGNEKFSTWILSELIFDLFKKNNIQDEALIIFINKTIITYLQDIYGIPIRYDVRSSMNIDNYKDDDVEDYK